MNTLLTITVALLFVALALWHFRMAFSPSIGVSGAVPSVGDKPLFVPSTKATLLVAIALLCFAALVAAAGGLWLQGLPRPLLVGLSYALALGLFARAVGDFKYVGFFKRVRHSRFAKFDTLFYSPLCLLLSLGVVLIARQHGA